MKLCHRGRLSSRGVDLKKTLVTYNLCFYIGDDHAFVVLSSEPAIIAKVYFNGTYELFADDCSQEDQWVKRLEFTLGIWEDQSEIYARGLGDPLLGQFLDAYRGLRIRSCDLWWGLVIGVCQQNASFRQGWLLLHRIVDYYGKRVNVDGDEIPRPPTPREILSDVDTLIQTGVGYRAKTIKNTAEFFLENKTRNLLEEVEDPRDLEATLTSIKGIGPYTARLAMVISLRRYELPPIDKWIRRIASYIYDIDESIVETYWSRKWGRCAGLAALYTTIALDAEPLQRALERIKNKELLPKMTCQPSPLNMKSFCTIIRGSHD